MSVTQATFFFGMDGRNQGWAESFYTAASSDAAFAALKTLIDLRRAFLTISCQIVAYRTSVVGPPRDSNLAFLTGGIFGTGQGKYKAPNENANVELRYKARTSDGHTRIMGFRGIPDDWENDGFLTTAGLSEQNLVTDYLDAVKAAGFGLIFTDAGANPIYPNDNMLSPPPGGLNAIVTVNPAFVTSIGTKAKVRIRSSKNRIYNSVWQAIPFIANQFTLLGSANFFINEVGFSKSQLVVPTVMGFNTFSLSPMGTRKTGKVFDVPRGRRSSLVQRR